MGICRRLREGHGTRIPTTANMRQGQVLLLQL